MLTGYNRNFFRGIDINFMLKKTKLNTYLETLAALSPKGVLKRGYSIAYTFPGQELISKSGDVKPGELFILETGDGRFQAEKTKDISEDLSKTERKKE